jgi:hypothetical protein
MGSKVLESLDKDAWLTIPRMGIWSPFSPNVLLLLCLLTSAILFAMGAMPVLQLGQLVILVLTCQLLFMTYENPTLWNPWTSYYPQKILVMFSLAFLLWSLSRILQLQKSWLVHSIVFIAISGNFTLDLPNPLFTYSKSALSIQDLTTYERETARALRFVANASNSEESFAFWNNFEWPIEGSANAWAGLAWEKYPGNWSMPSDDGSWVLGYSGPIGGRAYHDGNQANSENLCRLIDMLPNGSAIFTKNSYDFQTDSQNCDKSKPYSVTTSQKFGENE